MSSKSQKQIEYTLATHAIEKLFPSKDALLLCERMDSEKLSVDAAVASILERYGLSQVRANG